jgi:hypothetical protein
MPTEKELQEAKKRLDKKRAEQKKLHEAVQRKLSADLAEAKKISEVAQRLLATQGTTRTVLSDEDRKAIERDVKALQEEIDREALEKKQKSVMSELLAKRKAGGSERVVDAPVQSKATDTLGSDSEVGGLSSKRGGVAPSKVETASEKGSVSRRGSLSEAEGLSRSRSVSSASVAEDGVLDEDDNASEYGSVRSRSSSIDSEEEYYSKEDLQKLFQPAIDSLRKSDKNKEKAEELINEINEIIQQERGDLDSLKANLEKAQKEAKSGWFGKSNFKGGITKTLDVIAQMQTQEMGEHRALEAPRGSDAGRESVGDEELGQDMIFSSAAEDPMLKGRSSNADSREFSSWAIGEDDPIMKAYHSFAHVKKQLLQNAIEGLKDEDIHKIHNDQESIKRASDNKAILAHSNSDDISFHKFIAAEFTQSSKNPNGFRPVGWEKGQPQESKEVTERKSKICGNDDLVEKTKMTKVNGRDMKARTCNFPSGITEGTGPLHLSIILKDENGNNMQKDKAVYFTAHYDSNGKLKEMTYPIPIQFDKESGQGFFIRDNKTYTLPIDRDTFQAMQKQMDINRSNTREASEKELGGDLILQAGSKDAANQLRLKLDPRFSAEEVGGTKLVASSLTVDGSANGLSHLSSSKPFSKDRFVLHAEDSSFRERSGSLSKEPGPSSIEISEPEHLVPSNSGSAIGGGGVDLKAPELSSIKISEPEHVVPSNSGSAIGGGGLPLKSGELSSIKITEPEHPPSSSNSGINSVELVVSKALDLSLSVDSGSLEVGLGDDSVSIAESLKSSLSHSSSASLSSLPMVQAKAPASFQVPEAQDKRKVKVAGKDVDCYIYNDTSVYIRDDGQVHNIPKNAAQRSSGYTEKNDGANKEYQKFLKHPEKGR